MNHQYIETVGDTNKFDNLNNLNDHNKTDVILYNNYYNGYFSLFMWILCVALCFNFCKAVKTHNVYMDYQRQQLEQLNQNNRTNNMPNLPNYTIIQNKIIKIKEYTFNNELESENSEESCSICLENYKKNDTINILKCGHKYHEKCIDEWIEKSDNCPLCRLSI